MEQIDDILFDWMGNDQEIEFQEIEIGIFHEIEIGIFHFSWDRKFLKNIA